MCVCVCDNEVISRLSYSTTVTVWLHRLFCVSMIELFFDVMIYKSIHVYKPANETKGSSIVMKCISVTYHVVVWLGTGNRVIIYSWFCCHACEQPKTM